SSRRHGFCIPACRPGISPLSLHDALPIWRRVALFDFDGTLVDSDQALAAPFRALGIPDEAQPPLGLPLVEACERAGVTIEAYLRSEEHTSELQSRENLVCRLLLEKKQAI